MYKQATKALTLVFTIVLLQSKAFAAGFAADLHSASGLATSYAGSVTGSHDITDIHSNPATMSRYDKPQFLFNNTYANIDILADGASGVSVFAAPVSGDNDNNGGADIYVPSLYFTAPLTKQLDFGVSVNTPFGLETRYNDEWIGRYHAIDSIIKTVTTTPSLAIQLTEELTLGAGVQIQYIQGKLTKAVDLSFGLAPGAADVIGRLEGDDWGFGYTFGALYQPMEKLRLGMSYRSKIQHTLEGDSEISALGLGSDVDVNITTPEVVTFGLSYQLLPELEVFSDLKWTRWSQVNKLHVQAEDNPLFNEVVPLNWRNSLMTSIGANYRVNNMWLVRVGAAYEEGAVTNKYRTPRVPTGDRIWTSLGSQFAITDNISIEASYLHQFHKDESSSLPASANGIPVSSLSTDYDTSVNTFSVSANLAL